MTHPDPAPAVPDDCPEFDSRRFARVVADEITVIQGDRATLLHETGPQLTALCILFGCLLVNLVFFVYRPDYIALFVAASFYLNMFYFVSLLLPTNPAGVSFIRQDFSRLIVRLREIDLVPGTYRFTRLFINAFFINSRALSAGVGLIFTLDILYCIIAYFSTGLSSTTLLIVGMQALVIVVFYLLVWKIEPFSTRFVRRVERIRDLFSNEKIPSWIIAALSFFLFLIAVFVVLITIILLPGITVSFFLTQTGLSSIGYIALLLGSLGMSQYFVIRFIHGHSSRTLAIRLYDNKQETLKVLLGSLDRANTGGGVEPIDPAGATITLLESRIYQIQKNHIFGLFPVYVINLDFSVVLDCSGFSAIKGYIRE